ncbi:hypothetical protein BD779DRAFT_1680164 [Infundibulicybe gibba]|nr:hypothetical protein BD779DRAFT_1680164 [Infundibulicybe gibba]
MSDASANPLHHGDGDKNVISLKAVAVSEGDKLFVSVVDDKISHGTQTYTKEETLTFFGDYVTEDEKKDLTDAEKYELAKKREADGILQFQAPGFAPGDFSKFKATKTENPIKHGDYDVTITITGGRKVGNVQQSISAVFKGKGDIRVGEGVGTWRMASRNPNK